MKIGAKRTARGQEYRCIDTELYLTLDERYVDLFVLESECATCGRRYTFKTTRNQIKRGKLNRRCEMHRRPGHTVERERAWREIRAKRERRRRQARVELPPGVRAILYG